LAYYKGNQEPDTFLEGRGNERVLFYRNEEFKDFRGIERIPIYKNNFLLFLIAHYDYTDIRISISVYHYVYMMALKRFEIISVVNS